MAEAEAGEERGMPGEAEEPEEPLSTAPTSPPAAHGKRKLASKLQLSRAIIRNAGSQATALMPAHRLGDRIHSGKAVQLVVRDLDDRPAHRCKSIGPARIADAARLAGMRFPALILHGDLRIRPAKIAPEEGFPRDSTSGGARLHFVVHMRNAHVVAALSIRQRRNERQLRLARGSRPVRNVPQCPSRLSRTAKRAVGRCEIAQTPDRGKRRNVISRNDPRPSSLIRPA